MTKPRPSWFVRFIMITFRICFVTLLMTGVGMGLGLFVGILTTVIGGAITHHAIDLTRAYKVFAVPTALTFGVCTLLFQIVKTARESLRR